MRSSSRHENVQVTGHRRSRSEAHFFSVIDFFLALDWHIRYREPVLRYDHGQLKARAKQRFVPARKKPTGIGRFKLRSEHDLARAAALLLIKHVKKPLPLLIYFAGETKREYVIAGRKF